MAETLFYGSKNLVGIGSVGIGTTNPGYPFQIFQNYALSGTTTFNIMSNSGTAANVARSDYLTVAQTNPYSIITSYNFAGSGSTYQYIPLYLQGSPTIFTGGNVGIGTTSPSTLFNVYTTGHGIRQTDSGGGASVEFYTNSSYGWVGTINNYPLVFFTNNSNPQLTLTTAGNVGIGTTNPSTALEVVGAIRASSSFTRVTPSTAIAFTALGSGLTASSYNGIMSAENDGVGTKLIMFVNGSTRSTDGGTNGTTIRNDGGPLTIGSTAYVTSVLSSSDYRNKQNVIPYSNCLADVLAVPVIKYTYIVTDTPEVQYSGWFAHEIQAVAPYAVRNNKDEVDEDGKPIYQGVDSSKLTPILWGAIQELSTENTALKQSLATATARLDSLEARLAAAGL